MKRRVFLLAAVSVVFGQPLVGEVSVTRQSCTGPHSMTLNEIRAFWEPGRTLSFFEALAVGFAPRRGIKTRR
jgi:hypothetical protein